MKDDASGVVDIDDIYDKMIKPLPPTDRLRLVEKIVHDLPVSTTAEAPSPRWDWMSVRGMATNLLEGEDAQAWISRSRREADKRQDDQRGITR